MWLCKTCFEENDAQSQTCVSCGAKSEVFPRIQKVNAGLKDYIIVAALDIGNTYSGYAYSTTATFQTDPLKICLSEDWKGSPYAYLSRKTSTCLLLNSDKEFHSFGYEAENTYHDLVNEGLHTDFFFFQRFKMKLYNNENITRDSLLEDSTGKPVLAMTVFTTFIKALVEHLMKYITDRVPCYGIPDIRFVMTVPAIWNDSAKQFIRICAEKAGIPSDQLLLALESEAAIILFQYLPKEELHGSDFSLGMLKPGTQYMVVDLGGSAAYMTVHEKTSNGHLKVLCFATGDDCGGTSVDGKYIQMLSKIVGKSVMKALKDEEPSSYLELLEAFQRKKLHNPTGKVNIEIPYPIFDKLCKKSLGEGFKEVITSSKLSKNIYLFSNVIKVDADVVKELFRETIDNILSLIRGLLESYKAKGVSQLLLVGGFSKSMLVRDAIENEFSDKIVITTDMTEEPALSVLRGAVLYGHKPIYIESLIMRFTYGVSTRDDWKPEIYDEKHLREVDGVQICDNLFKVIVRKNHTVEVGSAFECELVTSQRIQDAMDIKLYVSKNENPKYIDDEGCKFFGSASICFSEPCAEKRTIKIGFIFGRTELEVHTEDIESGQKFKTTFNLL